MEAFEQSFFPRGLVITEPRREEPKIVRSYEFFFGSGIALFKDGGCAVFRSRSFMPHIRDPKLDLLVDFDYQGIPRCHSPFGTAEIIQVWGANSIGVARVLTNTKTYVVYTHLSQPGLIKMIEEYIFIMP